MGEVGGVVGGVVAGEGVDEGWVGEGTGEGGEGEIVAGVAAGVFGEPVQRFGDGVDVGGFHDGRWVCLFLSLHK